MSLLSNREIALAIWLIMAIAFTLSKGTIRGASLGVLRAFLDPKILTVVGFMILYTLAIVAMLHVVNFWNVTHIKGVVIWFFFTGIVLVVNFLTSRTSDNVFSKVIKNNVKVTIVIAFVINTYTFSLPVELAIIPLVTLLVLVDAVAQTDEAYSGVTKLTTPLLAVTGFGYLIFAVYRAAIDYQDFLSLVSFKNLLLAPVLSILFSPYIYVIVVVSNYEQIFVRLKLGPEKETFLIRYAKRKIIQHCKLSLSRINLFLSESALELMRIQTKDDVDRLVGLKEN